MVSRKTKTILKAFSKIIVFFFLFIKFLSNLHRIVCNIDKYKCTMKISKDRVDFLVFLHLKKKKMKKYFLSKTGRESRQKFRSVPFCFNEYNNLKFEFLKRFREGWPLDS